MDEVKKIIQVSQNEAKNIDTNKISYFALTDGTLVVVNRNKEELDNPQVLKMESPKREDEQILLKNQSNSTEGKIIIQNLNEQLFERNNNFNTEPNQINYQNNLSNYEYQKQSKFNIQSKNKKFLNENPSKLNTYMSSGVHEQSQIKNNQEILNEGVNYGFFYTAEGENNKTINTSKIKNSPPISKKIISRIPKQPTKKRQLYKLVEAIQVNLNEIGSINLLEQNKNNKLKTLEYNNYSYLYEPSKSTDNTNNKNQNHNHNQYKSLSKNKNEIIKDNSYQTFTQPQSIFNYHNSYQGKSYRNNYNRVDQYYNNNKGQNNKRIEITRHKSRLYRNHNFKNINNCRENVNFKEHYKNEENKNFYIHNHCHSLSKKKNPNNQLLQNYFKKDYQDKDEYEYEDYQDLDRYEEEKYYQNECIPKKPHKNLISEKFHLREESPYEDEVQYEDENNEYYICNEKYKPIYHGIPNPECTCPFGNPEIRKEYETIILSRFDQQRNNGSYKKYGKIRIRK